MTPHQGAGAGQAIEVYCLITTWFPPNSPNQYVSQDAYILAEVLGSTDTTRATLQRALSAYERVRLPMANHVLRGSRTSGNMYEFNGPLGDDLVHLGPQICGQWDWLWETTPQNERDRALSMVRHIKASL